jgi:hypothetical protein
MNDDGGSANVTDNENLTMKNCTQMSDCDVQVHEQCISGVCLSPKAPGDFCSNKIECALNCPASDCLDVLDGRKICVCGDKLYKYGRRCMKKCPQGTRSRSEKKDCEDTVYSRMLRDSPTFEKDIKFNSAC